MNPSDSTNDPSAAPALRDPTFIIEHQGVLYVTEGVLEYRWSEELEGEQREGVQALRRFYDEARRSAGDVGQESYAQPVVVEKMDNIAFMATSPPRPPAPPGG
jgi:hypothetical protein